MSARETWFVLATFTVLGGCSAAARLDAEDESNTSSALGQAGNCKWAPLSSDWSRFPAQQDPHAQYFATPVSDASTLVVEGDFPYATYTNFVLYDASGTFVKSMLDQDIVPNAGNTNPVHAGSKVLAAKRRYRIEVLPHGSNARSNQLVAPKGGGFLVHRVYESFGPGYPTSAAPSARAVTQSGASTACPEYVWDIGSHWPEERPATGAMVDDPRNPDLSFLPPGPDASGRFSFYRLASKGVPFPDGQTGYLAAKLDADSDTRVAIVHIAAMPTIFETGHLTSATTFTTPDVRFLSIGAYGASPMTDHVLSGQDMHRYVDSRGKHKGMYIIIGSEPLLGDLVRNAEVSGKKVLNFLRMPELNAGAKPVPPYLVYRNKAPRVDANPAYWNDATKTFPGFFGRVGLDTNGRPMDTCNGKASEQGKECRAEAFLGDHAPIGVQCSIRELRETGCNIEDVRLALRLSR